MNNNIKTPNYPSTPQNSNNNNNFLNPNLNSNRIIKYPKMPKRMPYRMQNRMQQLKNAQSLTESNRYKYLYNPSTNSSTNIEDHNPNILKINQPPTPRPFKDLQKKKILLNHAQNKRKNFLNKTKLINNRIKSFEYLSKKLKTQNRSAETITKLKEIINNFKDDPDFEHYIKRINEKYGRLLK
jgi:hypothetical protein